MSTREEILSLYKDRRKSGILDLDATFAGQIENQVRSIAQRVESDGTRYTVVSNIESTRNLFLQDEYWNLYPKTGKFAGEGRTYDELEKKSIQKFREKYFKNNDDYGFVLINAFLSVDDSDGEKQAKVQTNLRHEVYYNAGESQTFGFERTFSTGTENEQIIIPSGGQTGFQLLKYYLSSYTYSAKFRQKIGDFENAVTEAQQAIARVPSTEDLGLVKAVGVLIMTYIGIPDKSDYNEFDIFFPRPSGLEPQNQTQTTGQVGTGGTSGTSGTGGVVPPPDTTGLDDEVDAERRRQEEEERRNAGGDFGDPTDSNAKYTSVEGVKDDDVNAQSTDQGEDPINLGIDYELSDSIYLTADGVIVNEGLTGKPGSRGAVQQQQQSAQEARDTQPSSTPQTTTQPQSPVETNSSTGTTTTENNTNVVRNEQQDIKDAKIAEITNPDANVPNEPTEKGTDGVQGGNVNVPEGITAKLEDATKPPEKPPVDTVPPVPAIEFDEWRVKKENLDPRGIRYKGTGTVEKPGLAFKTYLNWGLDTDTFWSGLPNPESPLDVAIACNVREVGMYNKNLKSMFLEHSEQHLMIDNLSYSTGEQIPGQQPIISKQISGRDPANGVKGGWAADPHWCGIWTNFVLMRNTRYVSDENDSDIQGCSTAFLRFYPNNPVNADYTQLKTRVSNILNNAKSKEDAAEKQRKEKQEPAYLACKQNPKDKKNCALAIELWGVYAKEMEKAKGLRAEAAEADKAAEALKGKTNFINEKGSAAIFIPGVHYAGGKLTDEGKKVFNIVSKWPGAYIVHPGHVECLIYINPKNFLLITVGGNTGSSTAGVNQTNGIHAAIKSRSKFWLFDDGGLGLLLIKRGTKNPYTVGGITGKIKRTPIFNDYEDRLLKEKDLPAKERSLRSEGYDLLIQYMEPRV